MQEAEEVFLPPPLPIAPFACLELDAFIEVLAGAEPPIAGTGDHHRAGGVIVLRLAEGADDGTAQFAVKGVQLPRAVEGEDPHRTLVRDHEGGRHGARPIRAPLII